VVWRYVASGMGDQWPIIQRQVFRGSWPVSEGRLVKLTWT